MTADKRLVPELRFRGFTDAWEQRKLSELGDISTGNTPATGTDEFWSDSSSGYVWVTPSDIKGLQTSNSEKHLTESGWEKARTVPEKSVLITSIASIGKNTITTVPAAFNQQINAIVPRNNDASFILESMNYNTPKFAALAGKTATAIINKSQFSKFKIAIPKYREQIKIGELIGKFNDTIALHQRKVENLQKLKKAFLQKMFISGNDSVPKIRFSGFTDAWEQRKLSQVTKITMGQSPLGTNYTNNPNDHILVQGNADMKDGHVVPRVWTKQVTKKAEAGELILSVRAPVGDVGVTDFPVVLGRGVAGIQGNAFIFQLLSKMKIDNYWIEFSSGSTFESINSKDVKNARVCVPTNAEQDSIGKFFGYLDETIALHQRKQELLKKLKRAFMQKMFC